MHARQDPAPPGEAIRHADAAALAQALQDARADTLRSFAAYERALPGLQLPYRPDINPPLWELGHIGWFQEWWLMRNPERCLGLAADPDAARPEGVRAGADALYNSSLVAHATRWQLPLPSPAATREDLARQLDQSLALLEGAQGDTALYFHRLALLHEDMHHEAAIYMAQTLGIDLEDERWLPRPLHQARRPLRLEATDMLLGGDPALPEGSGFAFDNELGQLPVALPAGEIDSRVLLWGEYLPFVEAGGGPTPRYLRHAGGRWQRRLGSRWLALDPQEPAVHLSLPEAQAWCVWAGRRLPSEAEWLHAALSRPVDFVWGQVWEWTVSPFEPYPGFRPHPYRDYSAPWFDGRPVLKGASFATQPRLRHPHYRNFFTAERSDVPVGFRSCAC
jgi:EgtB-related family protein